MDNLSILITDCQLVGAAGLSPIAAARIEKGRLAAIYQKGEAFDPGADLTLEAGGGYLAPGFIDAHTHGGFGVDFTTCTAEEGLKCLTKFIPHGTTHIMPTFVTSPVAQLVAQTEVMEELKKLTEAPGYSGARYAGLYWEGPFISKTKKGAQPEENIATLDAEALAQVNSCAGKIDRMALAPEEVDLGNLQFADPNLKLVIGHTNATYEQAVLAANLGINSFVHTFNGMSGFGHRSPGVVGAAMATSETYCELICDGVHVLPAAAKVLFEARGADWIVLITDGNTATGFPPGEYELAGMRMIVKEDACYLPDGTLAGSVITMDEAVRRAARFLGASPFEAIRMATYTPARYLGWTRGRYGTVLGATADYVVLDSDLNVMETLIGGQVAWSRDGRG
jgi:N-acetylglucosamine-6-phosphate deacetylase